MFLYNRVTYLSKKQATWAALFQILEFPFEVDQNFLFLPQWGVAFLPSDSYNVTPDVFNFVTLTGHSVALTVDYPIDKPVILLYRLNKESGIAEILYAGFQTRDDAVVFVASNSLDLLKTSSLEVIGDTPKDKWTQALELVNQINILEV